MGERTDLLGDLGCKSGCKGLAISVISPRQHVASMCSLSKSWRA